MRRVSIAARVRFALLASVLATCAQPSPPPGGPPDTSPPIVLSISPESGAVRQRPGEVLFRFDEVVSERPQGVPDLRGLFLISPRDGDPVVRWRRDAIGIRPRRGWRENTVYTITMLPGLADLRGNVSKEAVRVAFSTGADFPSTYVAGRVFDWSAARPAPKATVEAMNVIDSTTYVALTDSTGAFELAALRAGQYAVSAFLDVNNNRRREPREAWDSLMVDLRDSARVELLAITHDTIGPRIATVVVRDSLTIRVTLDQPISPSETLTVERVRLTRADSTPMRVAVVATAADFEKIDAELRRERTDSIRRADSTKRAAADTGRRPPPRVAAAVPAADTTPAVADTATRVQLRPSRPAPATEIVIRLAEPLGRGALYRLRLESVRGLAGAPRTSERVLSTPRPAPVAPRDTTRRAPTDTTRPSRPDGVRAP